MRPPFSVICKLINAPRTVKSAVHHHARPEKPNLRPREYRIPETVGPKARHRLAVEAATPLIVPRSNNEGAELVRRMAFAGYANVANVHFHMIIP
jgi:hypothetical protein